MRIAILGAAGLMGGAIARDLAETFDELVLLDRRRAPGVNPADAEDRQALTLAIEGCDVLVNAASYRANVAAMDAALAARCAYVDLGGLYHVTAQQFGLDEGFAQHGILAVLGCGAGPGKTNVMAVHAAAQLETVERVRCASASFDEAGPSIPYARTTLLAELRERPVVLRSGHATAIEPLTDGGAIDFPEPVGRRETLFTLHSEALTLGESLGAADVDFRLGLHPGVREALLSGAELSGPSARTWSAQHVAVSGGGRTAVVTALTEPHAGWGLGGGVVSTASVAAAVVRLIGSGALAGKSGCHPPERVLPPSLLFPALEARGCSFHTEIHEVTQS